MTISVALLLMMPPEVALMIAVPGATAKAVPPDTVATPELLVVHVATLVISITPLQVLAFAV